MRAYASPAARPRSRCTSWGHHSSSSHSATMPAIPVEVWGLRFAISKRAVEGRGAGRARGKQARPRGRRARPRTAGGRMRAHRPWGASSRAARGREGRRASRRSAERHQYACASAGEGTHSRRPAAVPRAHQRSPAAPAAPAARRRRAPRGPRSCGGQRRGRGARGRRGSSQPRAAVSWSGRRAARRRSGACCVAAGRRSLCGLQARGALQCLCYFQAN